MFCVMFLFWRCLFIILLWSSVLMIVFLPFFNTQFSTDCDTLRWLFTWLQIQRQCGQRSDRLKSRVLHSLLFFVVINHRFSWGHCLWFIERADNDRQPGNQQLCEPNLKLFQFGSYRFSFPSACPLALRAQSLCIQLTKRLSPCHFREIWVLFEYNVTDKLVLTLSYKHPVATVRRSKYIDYDNS